MKAERNRNRATVGNTALASEARDALSRVRAVILLAGALRSSPFRSAVGRSVLDLPALRDQSLLAFWAGRYQGLAGTLDLARVPLRVIVDATSPLPSPVDVGRAGELRIERDPLEYRGTAGVLRDVCSEYGDDESILVANAMQLPRGDFSEQCARLAAAAADMVMLLPGNGIPSSLMLIRCEALKGISRVGFVDLKEQALPSISSGYRVKALACPGCVSPPIRTAWDYLAALRDLHLGHLGNEAAPNDPFEEDWRPSFSVVEAGADVDPSARIRDSVVLAGGVVQAGATVLRSIVGPGGVVRRGRVVLSDLVAAAAGSRSARGGDR